ncbi:MAG: YkgJ family cysteine cluster protein [Halobacteriales archaeon]|nr:YkgJ family cysteine cluster protein [Halobacteriales archaeon]
MTVERAESLDVEEIADVIEDVGFECTDCGDCCTADGDEPLAVTVFPDERRALAESAEEDGASPEDVTEPSPFGEDENETFEWTVRRDACGDCFFHKGDACSVYEARPSVCRTYPFAVNFEDDETGAVETHELGDATVVVGECEGTGRDISREDALELARAVKRRVVKEEHEARELLDAYEEVEPPDGAVVVHDSEGTHVVEK